MFGYVCKNRFQFIAIAEGKRLLRAFFFENIRFHTRSDGH